MELTPEQVKALRLEQLELGDQSIEDLRAAVATYETLLKQHPELVSEVGASLVGTQEALQEHQSRSQS